MPLPSALSGPWSSLDVALAWQQTLSPTAVLVPESPSSRPSPRSSLTECSHGRGSSLVGHIADRYCGSHATMQVFLLAQPVPCRQQSFLEVCFRSVAEDAFRFFKRSLTASYVVPGATRCIFDLAAHTIERQDTLRQFADGEHVSGSKVEHITVCRWIQCCAQCALNGILHIHEFASFLAGSSDGEVFVVQRPMQEVRDYVAVATRIFSWTKHVEITHDRGRKLVAVRINQCVVLARQFRRPIRRLGQWTHLLMHLAALSRQHTRRPCVHQAFQ